VRECEKGFNKIVSAILDDPEAFIEACGGDLAVSSSTKSSMLGIESKRLT